MSFFSFLHTRRKEASPVGDLVRDLAADRKTSKLRLRSRKAINERLGECNACDGAYAALDTAWCEYRARDRAA